MLFGSKPSHGLKPSNFKRCSSALPRFGACICGACICAPQLHWQAVALMKPCFGFGGARACHRSTSLRHARIRETHDAFLRQIQEARREAKGARREHAHALRRSSALTLLGVSLGQRRQLLRWLWISQGDYEAMVTRIDHGSPPQGWSDLSLDQKRRLLQDLEPQHSETEVVVWSNPLIPSY